MESPKPANGKAGQCLSTNCCSQFEPCEDDGSLWGDSDEQQTSAATDLDREWKNRREQYYNHGYREGTLAGQNDAAQLGFNDGFKDSVLDGHRWGIVRGISSALACLPDQLKEKMVESEERRKEFKFLRDTSHSISTEGALKLFHNEFQRREKSVEVTEPEKQRIFSLYELEEDRPDDSQSLRDCFLRMESLLQQCPKITVHLDSNESSNKVP